MKTSSSALSWPGRSCARITIENQRPQDIGGFFYQVDYALRQIPAAAGRFHAQWRHGMTTRELPEHTILDGITGSGQYVGTYVAWSQFSDGWWGEGEVKSGTLTRTWAPGTRSLTLPIMRPQP